MRFEELRTIMVIKRFKTSYFLLIFFLLSNCLPETALADSTKDYRVKKVISVVYDDSGSMSYEGSANWAYANYAMQVYLGLLNNDDKLFITYMSDPTKSIPYTNLAQERQNTVDNIHDHWGSGYTPITAVETAYNTLMANQEQDKNIEYSLVIITDGAFDDGTQSAAAVTNDRLNQLISTYSNTVMNNGANLNVTYFAIGDAPIIPAQTGNLSIYQANEGNLTDTLFSIADKTSGRALIDDSKVSILSDNRVQINSTFPLLSLGVLIQGTSVNLQSVTAPDGKNITWEKVDIKTPEHEGATSNPTLKGSTFLIRCSDDTNIPSGDIVLQFDQSIPREALRVMYEPALSMLLNVKREGVDVMDFSNLRKGDKVTIESSIIEMGTNKKIDDANLPANLSKSIAYHYDGEAEVKQDNLNPIELTLDEKPLTITSRAQLENFVNISKTVNFTPKAPIEYQIKADVPNGMKNINVRDIKDSTDSIDFYITADGVPISYDEAKDLPFDLKLSRDVPYDLTFNTDNGHYYFKLRYEWPLWFKVKPGELTLDATSLNGIKGSTTINLEPAPWYYLIWNLMAPILGILLVLIVLAIYIFRRRFKRKMYMMVIDTFHKKGATEISAVMAQGTAPTYKMKKFTWRTLLPIKISRKIRNLTFYPGSGANVVYAKINKNDAKHWFLINNMDSNEIGFGKVEYTLTKPTAEDEVHIDRKGLVQLQDKHVLVNTVEGTDVYIVYYYYRKD